MRSRIRNGYTLIEIMIVVLIIGALMAIAVPNFLNSRISTYQKSCVENLHMLDSAKEQWAMANKKEPGDAVAATDLVPTFLRAIPNCPAGGTYTLQNIGTSPTCTISTHLLPF